MSIYLTFAILGLGLGVVYVGLANGLILVFRATGIINFAMGATAMWGGYVYALARNEGRLYFPVGSVSMGEEDPGAFVAILCALASAVLIALLIYYLAFRPVRRAPVLAQVVVSVAVMLTMQALALLRFGADLIRVQPFLPSQPLTFGGIRVTTNYLWMAVAMILLSALAWAYLRFTRAGVATRAASSDERAAILMGYAPSRLAAIAMVMATVLATSAVLLASPLTGISPIIYTLYVVPALAVMLVARMLSIPVATLFGLAFGAIQSMITFMITKDWWPSWASSGVDQVLPFIVVMIALLAFGNRLPARGSLQTMRLPDVDIPAIRPAKATIVLLVVGVAMVLTHGVWRFSITISVIMTLLALSYVIITGYLGQISLAQVAFAGTAGFALSKFGESTDIPFPLVVLACALVSTALGVIVALPALRIRGAQLAIVTLAAALAIERFVFSNYSFTPDAGNNIGDPAFFGLDLAIRRGSEVSRLSFSLMVLVVAAVTIVVFVRIASGDLGRAFLAVRANERAAASSGINVRLTKMLGFSLSAFVAGVAGCLIGYAHGQLSASSFTVFVGLQVLAFAYLGGITTWGGAAVAGLLAPLGVVYTIVEHVWETGDNYALIAGLLLILTAVLNPLGIAGAMKEQGAMIKRFATHRRPHREPAPPGDAAMPADRSAKGVNTHV
ncbi:ABC transporter permease [Nocardioides sp. LML1-1-1.1]|uniref:ABC transporter permease n=1 Tax=Nocardioides sp. LML1-1-1.1 TaxID=3135248 RepID=UPI00342BD6E0